MEAGDGRSSPQGSGDTVDQDLCGQETGDSGGLGGLWPIFDICARDTGCEGGGGLWVPWWRQEVAEN